MKNKLYLLAGVSLFLAALTTPAAYANANWKTGGHSTYYSQSSYLSAWQDAVFQTNVDTPLAEYGNLLSIYFGVSLNQDTRSNQQVIYNDNYVAPLLGVRMRPWNWPIGLFAEYQQAFRLINRPATRQTNEAASRGGIYGYKWIDLSNVSPDIHVFDETYGESVYTTLFESVLSFTTWSKLGARYLLSKHLSFDLYAEGILKRATTGYSTDNCQDLGPAARISATFDGTSAMLSLRRDFYVFNDGDPALQPSWTVLLVLAGGF